MAARAAVRDAGRVLEVPYGVVDKIAKLIPEGPGQMLEECLKPGAELKQAVRRRSGREGDRRPRAAARRARRAQDGIHAAAVVIGAEPLMDIVPLQQKGADQEVVTQCDGTTSRSSAC